VVLELVLTVALTIDAVTITVLEGRVTGCVAGTTASTVELSVVGPAGDGYELLRRQTDSVALGPRDPGRSRTSVGHRGAQPRLSRPSRGAAAPQ
jgi:hypothetical protein